MDTNVAELCVRNYEGVYFIQFWLLVSLRRELSVLWNFRYYYRSVRKERFNFITLASAELEHQH